MKRFAAIAVVVVTMLASLAAPASADLDDELSKVAVEMAALRSAVGDVRSDRSDLANQILDTGDRLEVLAAELDSAEGLLADTDREIALTQATMDELSARMAEREERVAALGSDIDSIKVEAIERAVELYMQGESTSVLALFQFDDAAKINVGIAYAARVQEISDSQITALENLSVQETRERGRLARERQALADESELLEFQRDERLAFADLVDSRVAEVAAELAIQQEQLAQLQAEIAEIEGEIASLESEQANIQALIVQQSNAGGVRPGVLLRPVPGGVSSYYGYRIHPIYGDRRLHTGWDMNAGCGAPIVAAESGTVIFSGWKGGYGNAIIIDHGGGMSTLYGHQSRLGLSYGQSVTVGSVIGWIGTTGTSTSCHLHFEVRINGSPVDPAPYL